MPPTPVLNPGFIFPPTPFRPVDFVNPNRGGLVGDSAAVPSFDPHVNLFYSTVLTPPSPADSGPTLTLQAGDGAQLLPLTPPYNLVVWPAGTGGPRLSNAEIIRVRRLDGDVLTFDRAQEGSRRRQILAGDQIVMPITAKTLTDLETLIRKNAAVSRVKLKMTVVQVITSGIWTPVMWDTEDIDTDGYHDPQVPNRITIPPGFAGRYDIEFGVDWPANATGVRGGQVTKNTVTANTNVIAQATATALSGISVDYPARALDVVLMDGDWINANVFHTNGSISNFPNILALGYLSLRRISGING